MLKTMLGMLAAKTKRRKTAEKKKNAPFLRLTQSLPRIDASKVHIGWRLAAAAGHAAAVVGGGPMRTAHRVG